jgi:hypothetical protein
MAFVRGMYAQDGFLIKYCDNIEANPTSIVEVEDGYVIVGMGCYKPSTNNELIAFKVNRQGVFQWRCGVIPLAPGFADCSILTAGGGLTPDGTVVLGGYLSKTNRTGAIFMARIDPKDGTLLSLHLYKEYDITQEYYTTEHLAMCANGDVLLSGVYTNFKRDSMFLLRLSPNGKTRHFVKFTADPDGNYEWPLNANPVEFPNGDIMVGFCQYLPGSLDPSPFVAFLSADLQVKQVQDAKALGSLMLAEASTDGYAYTYIEGTRIGNTAGYKIPCLQKWTPAGDTVWMVETHKYGGPKIYDMTVQRNNNIVLSFSLGAADCRLDFFDPRGKKIRQHVYGVWHGNGLGTESERIKLLAVQGTSDGGVIAAGEYTRIKHALIHELCFMVWKTDSLGCIEAGCQGDTTRVSTSVFSPAAPRKAAFCVQPNPVSEVLTIDFQHTLPLGAVHIRILDVYGRWVRELRSWRVSCPVEMEDLTPGLYFVEVSDRSGSLGVQRVLKE